MLQSKSFNMKRRDDEDSKLDEASARMLSLEHANTAQAEEIERLLSSQSNLKNQSQVLDNLKEEYAELEDDCLKWVPSSDCYSFDYRYIIMGTIKVMF